MVAPGKNLEFFESPFYAAKLAPSPELANAITHHLESRPHGGEPVVGIVRRLEFPSHGQIYTVIFSRTGQKVCLMNIFEAGSVKAMAAYLGRLRDTFGNPGKGKLS